MNTTAREIEKIIGAIESHADDLLLLLTGFDGVLVEYAGNPAAVRLPARLREVLRAFSNRPDVALGIVSGRRVRDLKAHADLGENVFYVGLHGLEIEGPNFAHIDRDVVGYYQDRLHDIVSPLELALASVAGIRVEDKGAAIAVHTREAGPVDAVWARLRLLNAAADLVNSQEVRVVRGNHVFELMPNVGHPKAAAIAAIRHTLENRSQRDVFILYVGEDVVEDDAADVVEGYGVSAIVGRRAQHAHYHLASPAAVEQLIARLTGISVDPGLAARDGARS